MWKPNVKLPSTVLVPYRPITSNTCACPSLCVVRSIWCCYVFYWSHFNRYVMVSNCGVNFHVSHDYWFWAFFMWLFVIYISSLVKYLFRSSACFFIGLSVFFWVLRVLYMFWLTVLYQIYVPQIFSPSSLISIFLTVSFEMKIFLWMKSSLSIFFYGLCLLGPSQEIFA